MLLFVTKLVMQDMKVSDQSVGVNAHPVQNSVEECVYILEVVLII